MKKFFVFFGLGVFALVLSGCYHDEEFVLSEENYSGETISEVTISDESTSEPTEETSTEETTE